MLAAHPRRLIALAVAGGALLVAGLGVEVSSQQPTFRSNVDLIAVDVQVVDEHGDPIPALEAGIFEVSISGRRRRVVSADFIRHDSPIAASRTPDRTAAPPPAGTSAPESPLDGRTLIIAIDDASFEVGATRAAVEAATRFVEALSPHDRVGLEVYPSGARIEPTTERALIYASLGSVLGRKASPPSQYHLKPSEIVDITAVSATASTVTARVRGGPPLEEPNAAVNPLAAVQFRECPIDPACQSRILSEASALALHLEAQAGISLGGLQTLLLRLRERPGRKAVVLVSAGVVVSDRPGGRPDVGDLVRHMGQTAAAANAMVYTIHIDPSFSGMFNADKRRVTINERDRDRNMLQHWLEQFSDSAGGALISVPVGGGDFAFNRVLRETSAHYLLGVEPADADRDGRARQLTVKVGKRGMTVRSRQWVVVPARAAN